MQRYIQYLLLALLLQGIGTARAENSNITKLANGKLVDRFYEMTNDQLLWTGPDDNSEELRASLLHMVSNSAYMGLDKGDYHYNYIAGNLRLYNDLDADKVFTDAAISYLKDLYTGKLEQKMLGYDEVSQKNEASDNERILGGLSKVRNAKELEQLAEELEPKSAAYLAVKTELSKELEQKNQKKINALSATLNYYRLIQHFKFNKYIVVNICNTMLQYYQGGNMQLEMKVVTGKPATKTPRFSAYCYEVILYPYWNVPHSIAVKEIIPSYKRNHNALNSLNMEVIDKNGKVVNPASLNWSGFSASYFPYRFRQSTGCDNALGVIKFNISDPFSVYLHDTNYKNAFKLSKRYLSHGCIRIEQPIELGNYLLPDKIDMDFLKSCVKNQSPATLKINDPVPVFVVYIPAGVENGSITYYNDIYRLL